MSGEIARFFVSALPEGGGEVELGEEAARHARVLRLRAGDPIELFDGAGRRARGELRALEPMRVAAEPATQRASRASRVVLIQALPKGKKLDGIIRMTTELGVDAIHLATSRRVVARPDEARMDRRTERLERIAQEAARQSKRDTVPEIFAAAPLEEVAARAPEGALRVVLWEEGTTPWRAGEAGEVWIVVGPEGGFAQEEVRALEARGYRSARLGATTLRVETAAVVAVTLAMEGAGRFALGGAEG